MTRSRSSSVRETQRRSTRLAAARPPSPRQNQLCSISWFSAQRHACAEQRDTRDAAERALPDGPRARRGAAAASRRPVAGRPRQTGPPARPLRAWPARARACSAARGSSRPASRTWRNTCCAVCPAPSRFRPRNVCAYGTATSTRLNSGARPVASPDSVPDRATGKGKLRGDAERLSIEQVLDLVRHLAARSCRAPRPASCRGTGSMISATPRSIAFRLAPSPMKPSCAQRGHHGVRIVDGEAEKQVLAGPAWSTWLSEPTIPKSTKATVGSEPGSGQAGRRCCRDAGRRGRSRFRRTGRSRPRRSAGRPPCD